MQWSSKTKQWDYERERNLFYSFKLLTFRMLFYFPLANLLYLYWFYVLNFFYSLYITKWNICFFHSAHSFFYSIQLYTIVFNIWAIHSSFFSTTPIIYTIYSTLLRFPWHSVFTTESQSGHSIHSTLLFPIFISCNKSTYFLFF